MRKFKIRSYQLPKSSPWIVKINGHPFVVASTVARLLLKLEKQAKAKAKKDK